jgi:branched-chain amino acid transport system permease protein
MKLGNYPARMALILGFYAFLAILALISKAYADVVFYILLVSVVSQSLNIIFGIAGLVSLGQVVFLGIGMYTFTFLTSQGFNPCLSVIAGGFASLIFAAVVGAVLLRLRGIFFACATLILSVAVPYFIIGTGIVGGYAGVNIYKYISSFYNIHVLVFSLLMICLFTTILTIKILESPFGYSLRALKADHDAAETTGINTFRQKMLALGLSAMLTGIAGGILAIKQAYILPLVAFDPLYSIEAILVVLLGGPGTVMGPVLGAFIYEMLRDILMRFAPGFQAFIYGILVIAIILRAPEGIVGLLKKNKKLQKILV